MARRAHPWFRGGRGWFVTLQGKQHNLGITDPNDLAGAIEALQKLLDGIGPNHRKLDEREPVKPRNVAQACAVYLADLKARAEAGRVTRGHWRNTRIILEQFARAFPDVQICALRADQVEKWVETRPSWSLSTQNNAVGAIGALLKAEGLSLRLRKPPKESRGADTCLTDEQFEALILDLTGPLPRGGRKRGDLAELLRLLRETGARPGELTGLTAEAVDWTNCLIRLAKHKTRRHTGRDRVIHFNTAAIGILEQQRAKYGRGVLFRTRNGNPYRSTELWEVLGKASKRLGFRVVAYGQRHSFATRALVNGVPDTLVAGLLGQTSTAMLHKNYSHVTSQGRALKEAAELASRPNFSAQRAHEKCD